MFLPSRVSNGSGNSENREFSENRGVRKIGEFGKSGSSENRGFSGNRGVSEIGIRSGFGRRSHNIICSD